MFLDRIWFVDYWKRIQFKGWTLNKSWGIDGSVPINRFPPLPWQRWEYWGKMWKLGLKFRKKWPKHLQPWGWIMTRVRMVDFFTVLFRIHTVFLLCIYRHFTVLTKNTVFPSLGVKLKGLDHSSNSLLEKRKRAKIVTGWKLRPFILPTIN